jgi:probable rRNA maturation factor
MSADQHNHCSLSKNSLPCSYKLVKNKTDISRLSHEYPMLNLELQNASEVDDIPELSQMQHWLQEALKQSDAVSDTALTVRVVDAAEGLALNQTWRGKAYPTNVLSFPFEIPEGLPPEALEPYLGDLVVCAPVVRQEAMAQNKALNAHWAHLLTHGLLHLLGYDHQTESDAIIMESLETKIVTGLGYLPPYQTETRHG